MTIDEAIEELTVSRALHEKIGREMLAEAEGLGIEALKAHKARREDPQSNWSYLLLGETK